MPDQFELPAFAQQPQFQLPTFATQAKQGPSAEQQKQLREFMSGPDDPKLDVGKGAVAGFKAGFGEEPLGPSPETMGAAKKVGLSPMLDPELRVGGTAIDAVTRAFQGLIGAGAGAAGAATGSPALERDIRAAGQVAPMAEMGAGVPRVSHEMPSFAKGMEEPKFEPPKFAETPIESEVAQNSERPVQGADTTKPAPEAAPVPATVSKADFELPKFAEETEAVSKSEPPAPVEDRIRGAVTKLQGSPQRDGVRLSDLRKALPDISREDLDKELLRLFHKRDANLMNLDNPRDIEREAGSGIPYKGQQLHVLWMKPPKSEVPKSGGAAATPLSALLKPDAPAPKPTVRERFGAIGTTIKKILAPSTVDEAGGEAAAAIRREHGVQRRGGEQTRAQLEQFQSTVRKLSTDEKLELIDYIERRSETPGWRFHDTSLQPVADAVRKGYEDVQHELEETSSTDKLRFVEDYYSHQWKDPEAASKFFGGGKPKEGSGSFTRKRSMPTIAEGIRSGLQPLSVDPIETTLRYVENARSFIATNRVFDEAKANGTVRYFKPARGSGVTSIGSPLSGGPPEGWSAVNGRFQKAPDGVRQAYAPDGWARVYNNFISRGVQGEAGDILNGLQKTSNAITALELGLSGYHVATMANEAVVSGVARAVDELAAGRPLKSLKAIVEAPAAPFTSYRRGLQFERAYLGMSPSTLPEFEKIVQLGAEAGMRAVGKGRMADEYRYAASGDYWRAWLRGSLRAELVSDVKGVRGVPSAAGAVLKNVGRVMETVSAPLFQKYIPRLKNGAFYDTMKSWLEAHPGATHEEQVSQARQIVDSIDNRFGEMVQDNIFWNRVLKQAAQLVARSYSWDMGTLREIGGGVKDIATAPGKGWTRRASYVIALPITYGAMSAAYQWLHTHKPPESIQDLLAPQTGGTVNGKPERAILPGYMKDVFGWYFDPRSEAENKIATGPRLAGELLSGKDWKGDPIADYDANLPTWLKQYLDHVITSLGPISIKQAVQGQKPGSALGAGETMLGVRPAPMALSDPSGYDRLQKAIHSKRPLASPREQAKQKAKRPPGPIDDLSNWLGVR